jgi:hypothetical protein
MLARELGALVAALAAVAVACSSGPSRAPDVADAGGGGATGEHGGGGAGAQGGRGGDAGSLSSGGSGGAPGEAGGRGGAGGAGAAGGGAAGGEATGCPIGTTACGGECVSLSSDAAHCGACTTSCAAGVTCDQGACTGGAPVVDLRAYFPANRKNTLASASGQYVHDYTFLPADASFQALYDSLLSLGKPGEVRVWQKTYPTSGGCAGPYSPDFGVLLLGDDASVTEVGDWVSASDACHANTAFGYRDPATGAPSGLAWAPPGGLTRASGGAVFGLQVWRQNEPGGAYADGGFTAYATTSLVEALATYAPPYGRSGGVWHAGGGKTYSDVVRILFHHGPGGPGLADVTCSSLDPAWPYSATYHHQPGYQSYALEYYLAKGVGVVQESLLYTESSYFGDAYVCAAGVAMGATPADHAAQLAVWAWYADDP